MKSMQPHDEDWDLAPANGHENSRILLTDDFYWDCADDNSPLGNDTGADVISFYSETVANNPKVDPVAFLESMLKSWEMLIEDWSLTGESSIREQLANDPDTIRTSDDAVIGLAFAMYIMHGHVDSRIREMALTAIEREKLDVLVSSWSSESERRQRLDDFKDKLTKMQTAN